MFWFGFGFIWFYCIILCCVMCKLMLLLVQAKFPSWNSSKPSLYSTVFCQSKALWDRWRMLLLIFDSFSYSFWLCGLLMRRHCDDLHWAQIVTKGSFTIQVFIFSFEALCSFVFIALCTLLFRSIWRMQFSATLHFLVLTLESNSSLKFGEFGMIKNWGFIWWQK